MLRTLLIAVAVAVVPVCAQVQSPSMPKVGKSEAEKVVTIIRNDKIKTQAYCDLQKLAEQIRKAHQKKDRKRVDESFRKVGTIEETLGPEYRALVDGIQEIAENEELRADFVLAFGALAKLCTK